MTKAIVTGGAGFIGSHLVDKLIETGINVHVIDNLSSGLVDNINEHLLFDKKDIGDRDFPQFLAAILLLDLDIKYIYNLASIPKTQYSVENPLECHYSNLDGTLHVLEAIRLSGRNDIKVIHSSSCGIYGDHHDGLITEDALKNMGTPYSVQKYIQELYLDTYYLLYGIKAVMLRYFNVYGTTRQNENGIYPNVLAAFSKQAKNGVLKITGDGTQMRDMVHVFDVVDANLLLAYSDFHRCEKFNIGTGIGITMNQIAQYYRVPIEYIPMRPGEAYSLVADNRKAKGMLNWNPLYRPEHGIDQYLKNNNLI